MKRGRLKYDLAYGCFLFCGMTALLITVFGKAAKDDNTAALLGFFVAIPLALASFAAMVAALVLSAIHWRHWPLLILSALTVLSVTLITMVHGLAVSAFAVHPGVQAFRSRYGDALYSSLQLPDGQEEHWRELLLLGQGDAQYVDDPRGSSKLLATCSVHPLTRAFKVTIEDAC